VCPEDSVAEVRATGNGGKHIVRHPALTPYNDETGVLGGEPVEGLKQKRVVLAGLDRPHGEEKSQAGKLREGRGAGIASPTSARAGTAKSALSLMTRVVMERLRKCSASSLRSRATRAEVASV
jgi:hypothetical protein